MTHPAIRELLHGLARGTKFQDLARRVAPSSQDERIVSVAGLTTTAKALYLALLWQAAGRPLIVITSGAREAEILTESLETFFGILVASQDRPPQLLPALDAIPSQRLSPHGEILAQRVAALWRLAQSRAPITVAPIGSALLRNAPAAQYRQIALTLRKGDEIPLDDLIAHLDNAGYERRDPVEMVGEYSLRGGILDIFPAQAARPVRIEFFGDEIDSIRRFDPESQRSVVKIEEALVLPLLELPRSRQVLAELAQAAGPERAPIPGQTFEGWEFYALARSERPAAIFDLVPDALIVLDEPEQSKAASERLWKRLKESPEDPAVPLDSLYFQWGELLARAEERQQLHVRELGLADASAVEIPARPTIAFRGNMRMAAQEARTLVEQGNRVVFFAPAAGEVERLADVFQEYSVPFQAALSPQEAAPGFLAERAYMTGATASTFLAKGRIRRGVFLPGESIAIFGADDLFDTSGLEARPSAPAVRMGAFAADIADLKPGDFVVHATHGVGKFLGIREIAQGDQAGDFMLLEYAGGARLYVPLTRMDLVQKFRGSGESSPPLDKLGGATWTKTKTRVKAKMRDMAEELLKLYAERRAATGFSFSTDSNWQREFEDAFEYAPTRDQVQAVTEIKRDMESEQPMDRLLCGDVGFGKTEVAMRAAFKALGDGKQIAILAPTTVLAFQHFETFKRRFASFPVRVDLISRFRSKKEIDQTLEDLKAAKVDLLIGTHRLLSKDVEFADLGLLIVDEEQRFGVRHKERLKQIRKSVDVLTMSATPIPRTLHMSLVGMRDMSVIETPPKDRLAIHTVVAHFEPDLVRAAIDMELSRGGQVYFIHNRVDSIYARAASIQELVPNCRVGVGHGQMNEQQLERVLLGFMRHEYDVFVSTTIVENGIDIPLANTIIIENAERYGLSELYQLRGRVGRSSRRAYAYLLVPADTELSEIARKRLAALKEFSDLGAGFKIAALDLELRGAGNLLGGEQHGHISSVGFDTYVRLLEEAVQELKGEEAPLEIHSTISLGLDLRIPAGYIQEDNQRLRAYKRIADCRDDASSAQLLAELADRYGKPPEAVETLLSFTRLKNLAERLGVENVDRRHGILNIKFHQQSKIDPARLMQLVGSTRDAQFTPAGVLRVPVAGATPRDLIQGVSLLFTALAPA
ncbi:MAG: transcription-repair coupling factor [Acidobacteria bacterium]|nr:transcription-repair coupling factor [Acidobacteriota bacterium]